MNDTRGNYLKHFMFIKDFKEFRKYLQHLSDCDNNNLARNVKCGFCNDFYGTNSYVHDHEMKVHQDKME